MPIERSEYSPSGWADTGRPDKPEPAAPKPPRMLDADDVAAKFNWARDWHRRGGPLDALGWLLSFPPPTTTVPTIALSRTPPVRVWPENVVESWWQDKITLLRALHIHV